MLHLSPLYWINQGFNNWDVKMYQFWQFRMWFSVFIAFFSVFWFWMIFCTVLWFLIGPNAPLHYYRHWLVIAQHCPVFCAILYTYLCIHHWLIRMEYFFEYVISPRNILSTLGDIVATTEFFLTILMQYQAEKWLRYNTIFFFYSSPIGGYSVVIYSDRKFTIIHCNGVKNIYMCLQKKYLHIMFIRRL